MHPCEQPLGYGDATWQDLPEDTRGSSGRPWHTRGYAADPASTWSTTTWLGSLVQQRGPFGGKAPWMGGSMVLAQSGDVAWDPMHLHATADNAT